MKHLFTLFLILTAFTAYCAEPLSLVIMTTDGATHTVDANNLKMSISDGKLIVGTESFMLTDLEKMYFSGVVTSMTDIEASIGDDAVVVYCTSGTVYGKYTNLKEARATLPEGIYIVSNGVKSFKMAIK